MQRGSPGCRQFLSGFSGSRHKRMGGNSARTMTSTFSTCLRQGFLPLVLAGCASISGVAAEPARYFEINVVDKATGRGVPLVELVTVDGVRHITDNAGRVAYEDHGHAGQTV